MLCVVRNRIWLSRTLRASRREPRNYVGDVLIRHRFAECVSAPVRCTQLGTAGDDDCAQSLIADQRKERIIGDGASLCATVATRAVAGLTIGLVREFAVRDVPT